MHNWHMRIGGTSNRCGYWCGYAHAVSGALIYGYGYGYGYGYAYAYVYAYAYAYPDRYGCGYGYSYSYGYGYGYSMATDDALYPYTVIRPCIIPIMVIWAMGIVWLQLRLWVCVCVWSSARLLLLYYTAYPYMAI